MFQNTKYIELFYDVNNLHLKQFMPTLNSSLYYGSMWCEKQIKCAHKFHMKGGIIKYAI